MEKQEIIDQINKIKQQNKKYLLEIVKKKFLKQKYEPIDYIDAILKGKDTFKEINKNDLKKIDLNPYPLFNKYVQKYTESNIYSNRYRSLISKIIKSKIKKIDEKKFEKECSKIFLTANKNILEKQSVVKDYLISRKCTDEMIKKYKLGTNEFFKLHNILKPNIFFNIRKDINFFKDYEAVTFPSLTGFGGFRIIDKNIVQIFKYFFLRPREDLYGYIESKNDNILCLCEGIFDAIAFNQIGFKNCISFGSCCPSYIQLNQVEKNYKEKKN